MKGILFKTRCKYTDTILIYTYDYLGFKRCETCINNVMLIDKYEKSRQNKE